MSSEGNSSIGTVIAIADQQWQSSGSWRCKG